MNHAAFSPISFPHPPRVLIRGQLVGIENYEASTNADGQFVPEHVQITLVQNFVPQADLPGVDLVEQKYPVTLWQTSLIDSFRAHGFNLGAVVALEGYLVLTAREDGAVVPKLWPLKIEPAPVDDASNPEVTTPDQPKRRCFFLRWCQRSKQKKGAKTP